MPYVNRPFMLLSILYRHKRKESLLYHAKVFEDKPLCFFSSSISRMWRKSSVSQSVGWGFFLPGSQRRLCMNKLDTTFILFSSHELCSLVYIYSTSYARCVSNLGPLWLARQHRERPRLFLAQKLSYGKSLFANKKKFPLFVFVVSIKRLTLGEQ